MNAKKTWIYIVFGIAILIIIFALSRAMNNKEPVQKPTSEQLCYGTGVWFEQQITACWYIIKKAQENYTILQKRLEQQALSASGARAKISQVAKEFYDNNLSGTNVNF